MRWEKEWKGGMDIGREAGGGVVLLSFSISFLAYMLSRGFSFTMATCLYAGASPCGVFTLFTLLGDICWALLCYFVFPLGRAEPSRALD